MRGYKGYLIDQSGFRLLYENFVMVVGHLCEDAYCYNKLKKEETGIFRFKYEPTLKGANTVEILIDPWSENAAIWQLDLDLRSPSPILALQKIKDFPDYREKPYTENVNW